jgi:hypothetical protein
MAALPRWRLEVTKRMAKAIKDMAAAKPAPKPKKNRRRPAARPWGKRLARRVKR